MSRQFLSPIKQADFTVGVRIGRVDLAVFTLPVLLFQAIEVAWRAYMPRFLNQDVGLTLAAIALILLGARLLDAFADLLLGWLSDMIHTPFGRRKPWMVAGTVLVAAGAPSLFMAPPGASMMWIAAACLLLHIGYSLIITPHGGWGLELSDDSHQRTRIMGAKVWFGLLGSLGLLAILAILERAFAISLRMEMRLLGWAIAILAPLTVMAPILLFRERVRAKSHVIKNPFALTMQVAGDAALRPLLLLYMVTGFADAAAASSFLFLTEDVVGLRNWGATLMLIQPVAALIALPFWSRLSRRMDRHHILMLSYSWQAACAAGLMVIPAGALPIFVAILAVKGLGWGVDFMLLRAMVADVAGKDADRAPLAASFYGVTSVAVKLAMGMGSGAALWFVGSAGDDTRHIAIRLAHCAPAVIGAVVALFILRERARKRGVRTDLRWTARADTV